MGEGPNNEKQGSRNLKASGGAKGFDGGRIGQGQSDEDDDPQEGEEE